MKYEDTRPDWNILLLLLLAVLPLAIYPVKMALWNFVEFMPWYILIGAAAGAALTAFLWKKPMARFALSVCFLALWVLFTNMYLSSLLLGGGCALWVGFLPFIRLLLPRGAVQAE